MTAQGGDILAWLDGALGERESTARAALSFGSGFVGSDTCVYGTGDGGPYLSVVVPGFEGQAEAATKHFALYGPADVLRRCAADRKVLALHNVPGVVFPDGAYMDDNRWCVGCGYANDGEPLTFDVNDCPTLRALAEGYGWLGGER